MNHRARDTIADHDGVIRAIEPAIADNLDLLVSIDRAWQPTDYLPDLEAEDWREQVERFRLTAQGISDELLVILVGDMVTEEALPSYAASLNGLVRDEEGTSPAPWARWLRGWTAEENRHGDLLSAYLRLTGRVDMRVVEQTVHHLICRQAERCERLADRTAAAIERQPRVAFSWIRDRKA
jgi:acyl-[acyl-carrier-protein] desaturase